jgi:hypothetical protein
LRPMVSRQSVLVSGRLLGSMTRLHMFFSLTFSCYFMWGALSDERTGLYFAVHITLWPELRRTRNYILLSHLRFHQPGGSSSRLYFPQGEDQIQSFYDRRSFGQSVLVSGLHLGPTTNVSFTYLEIFLTFTTRGAVWIQGLPYKSRGRPP